MSVLANWEEDWITVRLKGNGGTWNKPNLDNDDLDSEEQTEEESVDENDSCYVDPYTYEQRVLRGVQFILDSIPFDRPGYQFVGWSEDKNST